MRIASVLVLVAAAAVLSLSSHPANSSANPSSDSQPVLVELFTSEGCSSCPPADALLKQLSEQQPFHGIQIIALEEHVDYWNHLGWADPFSSPEFSRRQETYSAIFPDAGVYTPQMIVDGRAQFIGSRSREARDQILAAASHPKAQLLLAQTSSSPRARTFELNLDPSSSATASSRLDLWVAITEKGLHSNVTSGENSGESLYHAPLVRQLLKLHSVSLPLSSPVTFSLQFREEWLPANLTVVAFLTDPHSRQVLAATSSHDSP